MQNVQALLDQYGESHQNPVNKTIHWVCIPLIVISLLGLLRSAPLEVGPLNLASGLIVISLVYYFKLSKPLALGMLLVSAGMLGVVYALSTLSVPLWQSSLAIFVGAWIAQFIGHKIEGKKPSFLEDLQFLMIGPLWLLSDVYRRLGIQY